MVHQKNTFVLLMPPHCFPFSCSIFSLLCWTVNHLFVAAVSCYIFLHFYNKVLSMLSCTTYIPYMFQEFFFVIIKRHLCIEMYILVQDSTLNNKSWCMQGFEKNVSLCFKVYHYRLWRSTVQLNDQWSNYARYIPLFRMWMVIKVHFLTFYTPTTVP